MKFTQSKKERKTKEIEDDSNFERSVPEMVESLNKTVKSDNPVELLEYLKSGYSLIHMRTTEDYRASEKIRQAVLELESKFSDGLAYGEWKSTTGFKYAESISLWNDDKETGPADVLGALEFVSEYTQNGKSAAIATCFFNVRSLMANHVFVQKLKDAAWDCRFRGSHIILVGPHIEFPPELINYVTVYDLELPNRDKFESLFRNMVGHYSKALREKPSDDVLRQAASSAIGMTELQGENAIALSMVKNKKLDPATILFEKEQAIRQSDVLEFIPATYGIDQLGGFDNLKIWLDKRKNSYTEEAIKYGLSFPRGILLCGVPGSGKSLASSCIASYFKLPLIKMDMGRIFKSLVGASEGAIRQALKTVEAVAPAVLWIDEIEKSMAGTNSSGSSDSGTTARVMSTVLTWMQENKKPVFTLATANRVEALPTELLRKGRFSEIWGVQEPTFEERKKIWEIHLGRVREDVSVYDINDLAEVSEGYTGAEIEVALQEAMFDAWNEAGREFNTDDLVSAIQSIIPQSVTSKDNVTAIKEWMNGRVRMVSQYDKKKEKKKAEVKNRKVRAETFIPQTNNTVN